VNRDAETIQIFFNELEKDFSDTLNDGAVQRSFLPNQSAEDIFERTRLFGVLLESHGGLQSVRFVDSGGNRIHYSTYTADILRADNESVAYRNYNEITPYIPFEEIAVPEKGSSKITLDQGNERIVFSFPFYDSMEIYRGTAVYSLSIRALGDRLIAQGRIKVGDDLSVISVPPGIVSGIPNTAQSVIIPIISSIWEEGLLNFNTLEAETSQNSLAIVSAKTEQGFFIGRVIHEDLFAFPMPMKLILLASLFLTLYLTIFLFFNLRPDTMTVIQNRLKGLQISLIREYYERKGEMDWDHWYRELELRREDVRAELKRGIKTGTPAEILEDVDTLIDKSWDEILVSIGGKREARLAIDEDKLQNILNRMLIAAGNSPVLPGAAKLAVPLAQTQLTQAPQPSAQSDPDQVEELEELFDDESSELVTAKNFTETSEGIEELEELDDVETLEDAEPVDELEEIQELDDDIQEVVIQELDEAGEPEPAEKIT
jgi:hypothetical protein